MLLRLLRVLQRRPEVRRGQPARLELGIGVALLEQALLVDVPEQKARHRPRPDALHLGFPALDEEARAAQQVPLVAESRPRVDEERRRLQPAGGAFGARVERPRPALDCAPAPPPHPPPPPRPPDQRPPLPP